MSFVGKKNLYVCGVGHATCTIDRDEGFTPFIIKCRYPRCERQAFSSFYQIPQEFETMPPKWEWYTPAKTEYKSLTQETREYVDRDGLLLRLIETI